MQTRKQVVDVASTGSIPCASIELPNPKVAQNFFIKHHGSNTPNGNKVGYAYVAYGAATEPNIKNKSRQVITNARMLAHFPARKYPETEPTMRFIKNIKKMYSRPTKRPKRKNEATPIKPPTIPPTAISVIENVRCLVDFAIISILQQGSKILKACFIDLEPQTSILNSKLNYTLRAQRKFALCSCTPLTLKPLAYPLLPSSLAVPLTFRSRFMD
jgi:hypothetical protein